MRQYVQLAIWIAVVAGMACWEALLGTRNYAADNPRADDIWSTKKIMVKLYVGRPSLMSAVYKDIHKAEPDWKTAEKHLAEIIRLMSMLTRQKPLRGSQEAWDELVQDYVRKAKAAQQNIKECKLQLARGSLVLVLSTCDNCHDTHGIK
jgi:hypothetical protein